jgi:hypothetical protein
LTGGGIDLDDFAEVGELTSGVGPGCASDGELAKRRWPEFYTG